MAFWSSETLRQAIPAGELVQPYNGSRIQHGAYELSLGPEAYITSNKKDKKTVLADGEQLVIPPGQFGLLLTEEIVTVPPNALGFISIKAGIKFRGLVNVSGFHIDPGFRGRLKFSVYNAGSQNIVLSRNQSVFLLWFSSLDVSTSDLYNGGHNNQSEITADDVMLMQGKVTSPVVLDQRLTKLEQNVKIFLAIGIPLLAGMLLWLVKVVWETPICSEKSSSTEIRAIQPQGTDGQKPHQPTEPKVEEGIKRPGTSPSPARK